VAIDKSEGALLITMSSLYFVRSFKSPKFETLDVIWERGEMFGN